MYWYCISEDGKGTSIFCFHSPIPNMRPRVHGNQGHEHLCSSNTGEIISREYGAGIYLISVFVTI